MLLIRHLSCILRNCTAFERGRTDRLSPAPSAAMSQCVYHCSSSRSSSPGTTRDCRSRRVVRRDIASCGARHRLARGQRHRALRSRRPRECARLHESADAELRDARPALHSALLAMNSGGNASTSDRFEQHPDVPVGTASSMPRCSQNTMRRSASPVRAAVVSSAAARRITRAVVGRSS